jgi:hypothetical protein
MSSKLLAVLLLPLAWPARAATPPADVATQAATT